TNPFSAHLTLRISFPASGYVGVAARFAEAYSQCYESPKEFLYMDLLALIGVALSGRYRVGFGRLMTQPRLYLLKIAPTAWSRKSTSTSFARDFLQRADPGVPVFGVEPQSLLRMISGAGSAEGLAIALDLHCRVALIFDEFRRFDKKANIEGSVLGSIINELSDGNTYANYTKTEQLEVCNGHLGVLANT